MIGAVLVAVMLEALREPGDARYVFYGLVLLGLVGALRLSWRLAGVLTGTVALGFVLHAVADAVDPAWVDGRAPGGASWLADLLRHWTIVPADVAEWLRPVTYVGLVASVLVLSLVRGWTRIVLLVPVLVLASFVWENVMLTDPASTRYVLLGAMLVGVMVIRPAGLLGERRVEIV